MKITVGHTFDDLLLRPKYSNINSRSDIDTSVDLGKGIKLKIPIISANMKNITEEKMAQTIANLGGLALLHRFMPWKDIAIYYTKCIGDKEERRNHIGCSVGIQKDDFKLVDSLVDAGCKIICVDVAHGHHANCGKMTEYIAKKYSNILLIAGNIATADGAKYLHQAGANVIKAGVGPGSLCSTRIETGNGVAQITALDDVYTESLNYSPSFKIIADGGIKNAGSIVKGLCFSHAVMLGNLLAGTNEAPGVEVNIDGTRYKEYSGSSTYKSKYIEGVSALVKLKGPVTPIIEKLMEGLRSGMSYQGVGNLEDLKKDPEFVLISNAGLIESHPNDVNIKG